jgi:Tol biopolymer transport system component
MNADGTQRSRLTTHPGREWFPAWSPNSRRIAFMSGRDGNFEIYVMEADGSNQTRLTSTGTADANPTWSPSGGRIAYSRTNALLLPAPGIFISLRDTTRADIIAVRPDGSDPVAITHQGIQGAPDYRSCP